MPQLRLALVLAVALACAGDRPSAGAQGQMPASTTAPSPAATGPVNPRSPALARPLFLGTPGPAGEGAARLALGDHGGAREGFLRALAVKPLDDATRVRLTLLVAVCDAALGRHAQAAPAFEASAIALPVLADYANYMAARSSYHTGDRAAARRLAALVPADSIWDAERRLLIGDVLRADGAWREVLAHYERYLDELPNGMRRAEARYRVGEAQEKTGKTAAAIETYRSLAIDAPLDGWGNEARTRIDAIAPWPKGAVKKVKGRAVRKSDLVARPRTAAEWTRRGMAFFGGMRNPESEAAFTAALATAGITEAERCVARYHQAQSVFKARQRARSGPLFDQAAKACELARDHDLFVRALYQGARGWNNAATRQGRLEAIARFERAETVAGTHSFADDARLRRAETWDELAKLGEPGAADRATALLAELPGKHPAGDMASEALWRLAWREYKARKYAAALSWLDKLILAVPHDENYYAEGQALYWRARTLEKLGRAADAIKGWEETVREYPLSYYSLLALNRLRERDPRAPARLLGAIEAAAPKGPELTFRDRPVFDTPGFARALELLRLGLGLEAERELARLGLRVPSARSKVTDPDRIEELWATAMLYDAGGRVDKSHWIARWALLDYRRQWPTASARRRWDIAYPRGWWHLIEPAAKAQGYQPELLISFVREESAFTPTLESFANAIGLTQMILPTAKRFSGGLGFTVSRETLREPDKNIALGSRFLGFLVTTFERRIALIVPSYNAGEGATFRWLCERPGWAQDEWGEEIPFDETRNYTKRVIGTFFTYSYLGAGTIPEMPNTLPAGVLAARKCPAPATTPTVTSPDGANRP